MGKLYNYDKSESLKYKMVNSYLKIGSSHYQKYQSPLEFNDKETDEGFNVK